MAQIIAFPKKEKPEVAYLQGQPVLKPTDSAEFLTVCKRFLCKEDYESMILAIVDIEYFNEADSQIKSLVDAYFSFDE